ncbi:hypothetical protein [Ammoniphilus resinae]|uniref:Ribosomal protein S7 n=1 Tax=Ammoniphilus resinae TaxID=861532 RepID=A0ABS4GIF0_9BACL|nr:hypothetical protein [Ammoniphilus resinae]MBP1930028.1 ribosomal protein S7 [Ammoniphilus resinae]
MVTYHKYAIAIGIWALLFGASFYWMTSREEEQLLVIQKAINNVEDWQTYQSKQVIWADDEQVIELHSRTRLDPDLTWVSSRAKLTDTEDFSFEMFFSSDVFYIHSTDPENWKKVDYTHPVAGELEGSREPTKFWLRLLKHTKQMKREIENGIQHYTLELKPFRDEVHGMRLEDVTGATMELWLSKETLVLQKMKVHVELKPSITKIFNQMDYLIEFSDVNQPVEIELPSAAEKAEKLQ